VENHSNLPLQFGYFFSLLMALIFWVRSYREERLSDRLMGFIMLVLALELQDYTFGFAGINVLWEDLNGFPRSVGLLLGPLVFLYLKSQTQNNYQLKGKEYGHFLPYAIYFVMVGSVFVQGPKTVKAFQSSSSFYYYDTIYNLLRVASYISYFYLSIKLYRRYRAWTNKHYSNPDAVSFAWFRNFIYVMILWLLAREIMGLIDAAYDLPFYQDWWWNLLLVAAAFYLGIQGLNQKQVAHLQLELVREKNQQELEKKPDGTEYAAILKKLEEVMKNERLYLQAELNLADLAKHLDVSYKLLSAAINKGSGMNFNDYINHFRISAFEKMVQDPKMQQFTLLALAMDCGFNSKATFNRAFKKLKGRSPQQYVKELKELTS
jgi:AraC-like DNA-binding protein